MLDKQILELPGIKPYLALSVVCSVIVSTLIVFQAFGLASAIVNLWSGQAFVSQVPWIVLFAVCFIARKIVVELQSSQIEKYACRTVDVLRGHLIETLYDRGDALIGAEGVAALVTNAVDGSRKIENYIALVVPKTISLIVVPLCLVIAIFSFDVISGIIVLVCYPFIMLFMRLIGHTASDESAKRHEGFVRMSNHFLDSLRGMGTLKAFGISKNYAKTIYAASEAYRKQIMKTLRIATLSGAVLDVFATCGLAAVAIMLGFRMVEGGIGFLSALTVLMLVPEYFLPIKAYASDYHASLDGKSALDAMRTHIDTPPLRVDLTGLTLAIQKGSKVAFIGGSGSGKTTLLKAICGLIEQSGGDISLDGDPVADLSRVSFISQHPSLLHASVADNVRLYNPCATDEEICLALSAVGLGNFETSLECGLATTIGEGARELSGGEAHRIALARALVAPERDIWVFDEPTSDLDVETEYELKQTLLSLMEDKTVLFATHRMHWLEDMDEVINVEEMDLPLFTEDVPRYGAFSSSEKGSERMQVSE